VRGLTSDELAYRVDDEANSIAWLCWHLARVQDDHLAGAFGVEQVWPGFMDRFGLPFGPDAIGYGHDSSQVALVQVSGDLLTRYQDAVHEQTVALVSGLIDVPVIGLPVSTGYGRGGAGEAALTTMLQSCSTGLVVVNIDNGVGAGAAAVLMAQRRLRGMKGATNAASRATPISATAKIGKKARHTSSPPTSRKASAPSTSAMGEESFSAARSVVALASSPSRRPVCPRASQQGIRSRPPASIPSPTVWRHPTRGRSPSD